MTSVNEGLWTEVALRHALTNETGETSVVQKSRRNVRRTDGASLVSVPKLHDVYVDVSLRRDPQLLQRSPVVRVEGSLVTTWSLLM